MARLGGAAVFAALLLAAGAVRAQDAAPGPVDSERLALAQKIYARMGDQTTRSLSQAIKGMLAASLQDKAGADPARAQAIQAALGDSLDEMTPKVVQGTSRIMAEDFSAKELRDMLAFYDSPTAAQENQAFAQLNARLAQGRPPGAGAGAGAAVRIPTALSSVPRSCFAAGLVLGLLLASAGVASAQEGALTTAQPDPRGLSPPVVAGSTSGVRIDAKRLATAQQIYDIAGAPALRATTRSLTSTLGVQLGTAMQAKDSAHAHAMVEAVQDGLTSITPQLQNEAVSRIARDFTSEQLGEMLAFYQTPTGALAARRMPLILQQTVGSVLTYIPDMMKGIEDSYCSRVKCTRAERKAFDDVAARMSAAHANAEG